MKIHNDTKYRTRTLRAILTAVRRHCEAHHVKMRNWGQLLVQFVPAQHANSTVRFLSTTPQSFVVQLPAARPLTERIVMKLANEKFVEPPTITEIAEVALMGLYRSNGYGLIGVSLRRPIQALERKYGKVLEGPAPKPKVKQPKDKLQERRYKALLLKEKNWQRKAKLASTKLKALKKKRKYYEKELGIT